MSILQPLYAMPEKKYHIHVSLPSSKFNTVVKADSTKIESDRIYFYLGSKLVASFPNQYTCIDKVE